MTLGKSEGNGAVDVGARASVGVLSEVDSSTMMVLGSHDSESVMVAVAGMLVITGVVMTKDVVVGESSVAVGVVSTGVSEGTSVVFTGTVVETGISVAEVRVSLVVSRGSVAVAVSLETVVDDREAVAVGGTVALSVSVALLIEVTDVGSSVKVGS